IACILIASALPLRMSAPVLSQTVSRDPGRLSRPAPSLMATDKEVNDFFEKYTERYQKKDLDGFLWLFSLKAMQNQRGGLPEIRQTYSDFFNRSQSLKNSIEGMKIEIYQNAVEVKARYMIDQILKERGEKRVWKGSIRWVLTKEEGTLKILSLDYHHERTP
ncbi:MAG TPA: hypothetical protein VLZ03_08270, partial [Thermodesulfobacteriota bacterium]|nr:hypothetical protein [Thermodesulfobacteriota bacterium]